MKIFGKAMNDHNCRAGGCNNKTKNRIGDPDRQPIWHYLCDDHLRQLYEELKEYFEPLAQVRPCAPDDGIAEAQTASSEDKTLPDETVSDTEPIKEPKYYICKQCGEKFLNPGQLSEYRNHCLQAHRAKKDG